VGQGFSPADRRLLSLIPGSFNGRTAPFEGAYRGSNPCPGATVFSILTTQQEVR
jgi:hypothetical protein